MSEEEIPNIYCGENNRMVIGIDPSRGTSYAKYHASLVDVYGYGRGDTPEEAALNIADTLDQQAAAIREKLEKPEELTDEQKRDKMYKGCIEVLEQFGYLPDEVKDVVESLVDSIEMNEMS